MFYNTSTSAVVTYDILKETYPMFCWPKKPEGTSVDLRLEMTSIHPDITYYKRLIDEPKPFTTRYQIALRNDPVLSVDGWTWGWRVEVVNSLQRSERDAILLEEMKEYRDNDWQNASITLTNGAVLQINERTRRDVQDTLTGLITLGVSEYTGWNAVNGVYTLTVMDFQEAIAKALLRVKESFDAYNYIINKQTVSPYEDDSWKDDFDNFEVES